MITVLLTLLDLPDAILIDSIVKFRLRLYIIYNIEMSQN